jgi:hypothetical protein
MAVRARERSETEAGAEGPREDALLQRVRFVTAVAHVLAAAAAEPQDEFPSAALFASNFSLPSTPHTAIGYWRSQIKPLCAHNIKWKKIHKHSLSSKPKVIGATLTKITRTRSMIF